jgi:SAM-dependent methyltransferase
MPSAEETVEPVRRYHWETPEYADAFATLLRALDERPYVNGLLRDLAAGYPRSAPAIDWGAGGGDLTRLLLEHFETVYAVEPNPSLRAALASRYPRARVFDGTLQSFAPPTLVALGVISHVYYHVPDHKWGAYTMSAARHLAPDGVLVVVLGDPEAGSNAMLEHFGAPRFDLYRGLADVLRRHREFDFTFTRGPASVRTTSFEDTLTAARFVLCDRDADAFSRPVGEAEFRDYVRTHFWDATTGTGGWPHGVVCCLVRPNPRYGR